IREHTDIVTQITTVKVPPNNQSEVLGLIAERARFMATQPGFISVSLHRSEDGSHVVNYVQGTNREKLEAAHHSSEFRKKWPRFGELIKEAEPCLYHQSPLPASHPGARGLRPLLEAFDLVLLDHGEPDIVEAVEQAVLAVRIDVELHHAAVGTPDLLLRKIDRQRRIGAAFGIVEQLLQIPRLDLD